MSHTSIFEKKWLEIVFENKNKEYGAYQLRNESPRTTFKAFIFAVILLFGGIVLLSSFSSTKAVINTETETVIRVNKIFKPNTDKPKAESPKSNAKQQLKKEVKNAIPIVVKTPEAQLEVPKTSEIPKTNGGSENGSPAGTSTLPTTPENIGSGGNNIANSNASTNTIYNTSVLEVNPSFPGGINKFYEYVAKNFNAPSSDEDTELIRVTVSFVIEKDGSLSNVKVLNSAGSDTDKEAVRVLKSLKTKWNPGKMGDNAVRSQYILPIVINPNP